MNKKAIWLIIGLMSAALIGIGLMQVNWITYSLNLNEEDFNNRVTAALNEVADRLELQEQLAVFNHIDNGFSRSFNQKEVMESVARGDIDVSVSFESMKIREGEHLSKTDILNLYVEQNSCTCNDCVKEKYMALSKLASLTTGVLEIPIAERLELDFLDANLTQELEDHGIKMKYNYGVFSNNKNSFVIANNHYVVEDSKTQPTKLGYKNLYNSKYRVNLFQADVNSPGMLMLFFPEKASFVWSSVWKNLLASVLFTGIILFCFAYTISVIIKQKKVSEMKGDFINNMTHEFKTPIATISLATDSISSPKIAGNPDKVRRFANIIKQENIRMNNQVEKVLQMAMLDKKDFSLKLTAVNLHEIIGQATENITLSIERKEGLVTTDLQADKPIVEADLTHLSNIVNNLLDNANKYSPEKPEISVATRNVNDGVQVIITDKGIGMSNEARKHIFDRFYRVHTGDRHDVKGFGLGLSYVKAMIVAHKGQINVKSDLGKGSSFTLFFPFTQEK
ncbi:MAG: two-component system phosphate regulon sensor histidine kinase PhoR [Paraglaciecola sp.]|jgi:two-component system phosphate regulon sensor histidine kinase PhoR